MAIYGDNKVLGRIGIAISAVAVFPLVLSGVFKVVKRPEAVEAFIKTFNYPERLIVPLGMLELFIVSMYSAPRTRTLGAILATGYLGGAVATHVRLGQPYVIPMVIGVLIWGGLYLRDSRIRALLPLTKDY